MTKDIFAIPSIPPGVKLTTLKNGLTIIVRELTQCYWSGGDLPAL